MPIKMESELLNFQVIFLLKPCAQSHASLGASTASFPFIIFSFSLQQFFNSWKTGLTVTNDDLSALSVLYVLTSVIKPDTVNIFVC